MTALERFVALVRRELSADDVRIGHVGTATSDAANVLSARLPDGRHVMAVFASKPANRDALSRRLEMLVKTFAEALEEQVRARPSSRPPPSRSLQDELRALAMRARAINALVIDARSPVVWGSSATAIETAAPLDEEKLGLVDVSRDVSRAQLVEGSPSSEDFIQDTSATNGDAPSDSMPSLRVVDAAVARDLSERAVSAVRALPGLAQLAKGRYLAHGERDEDFGYFAHSFASIYLCLLVFDAPYDELRAERSLTDALPRIERLVLALPPLDPRPAPIAGVVSLRRSRKR
jgi:hypothetical protein